MKIKNYMKTYSSLEEAGIDSTSKPILLGRGSYGKVRSYLSRPDLAVKTFKKKLSIQDDRVTKELNFFHFADRHKIPWVPTYHGYVIEKDTGRVHLLMERCGTSLFSFLKNAKPSKDVKRLITRQMIQIVYELGVHHALCHLDLKTPNFLWDAPRKHLFLVDWGLCLIPGMRQGALTSKGDYKPAPLTPTIQTRDYRAPEVFLGGSTLPRTFAIDLWSLGMCLLEIWNGPFVGAGSLSSGGECGDKNGDEYPTSPVMLKRLLSTFGPLAVLDDADDKSNEEGPLAGWKAFYDPDLAAETADTPDADHVFDGFLAWVRAKLLATHPGRRITHAQLKAHPCLGPLCTPFTNEPWVKPPPPTIRSGDGQVSLRFSWWTTLTEWLWEVTQKRCQDLTSFFLGSYAIYMYLGLDNHGITKTTLQALGVVCMFYVGLWCTPHHSPYTFADWACLTDKAYTAQELEALFCQVADHLPPLMDLWPHTPWHRATLHDGFGDEREAVARAMARDLLLNEAHFQTHPQAVAERIVGSILTGK